MLCIINEELFAKMSGLEKCRLPCPVMKILLRRVLDPSSAPDSTENRTRIGMLAGWVSTVISLLLCTLKGWLGLVSGSISMVADATNNLTDAGSSLVIALGFQWSRKPQDEEHPFGHGRIEAVATLVLSIALLLVGFEVAKSGVMRLVHPAPIVAPPWVLVMVGATVVVKLWMAVFANGLARLSKSHVLKADAWNHAYDVLCTLLVVVALVGANLGVPSLDGWTALGVSGFILYTGVTFAREAVDILLGTKPDPVEVAEVHSSVENVEGVLGVHEIMVHQYGDVKMVSFHIEVDANLSLSAAHVISEAAEDAVELALGWRTVAHIDPVDRSHPLFDELNQVLNSFIGSDPELIDFHDLRAEGEAPPYRISFDLVVGLKTRSKHYSAVYERTLALLADRFSHCVATAEIGIEAAVDSAPMERQQFCLIPDSKI